MRKLERVVLWILVIVVFCQNSLIPTEDKISDIASDVVADEIRDFGCVKEDSDEEYVTADAVNEVFSKVSSRMDDEERGRFELEGRVLGLELKED